MRKFRISVLETEKGNGVKGTCKSITINALMTSEQIMEIIERLFIGRLKKK